LSQAYNSFGTCQTVDEVLCFLVLKGCTEMIESNGIARWIYEFVLLGIG
jgi:hypothetical protein